MPSNLFFGITSGLTTSSKDWSQRTTPMALSPTLIWSLLEDYCTWRHSPRPLTSLNILSYQKGITSTPLSGSEAVVPLQTSLLLTFCGSLESTNVATATSHGLTTFLEPPTTLMMHCLEIFILLGRSSLPLFHLICPRMSDIKFGPHHCRYFPP